ncbi:MAG TPA: tetratricopeptide repeat protein [Terriglobales bacterium]
MFSVAAAAQNSAPASTSSSSSGPSLAAPSLQELFNARQWQEVIRYAKADPHPSPNVDFYYGSALAQLGKWDEARKVFQQGQRLDPTDERFPVELAGVAFKQKQYDEAVRNLHRALKLKPGDEYANDFLGTVYFLQGNLEASLKYWNRVSKPRVASIEYDPTPKLDAALLDHAFAFSRASTLRSSQLNETQDRLQSLATFSDFSFGLSARPDGDFDVTFHNRQKQGWKENKWIAAFMLLRGLPAQTIYPEAFNLKDEAFNFTSAYRWDAQKRRIQANLSGPLAKDPKRGFGLGVDLRDENWALLSSFTGPATSLGGLNLRREAVYGKYSALPSERLHWSAEAELSHRDFRSEVPGPALTPSLLSKGFQLKEEIEAQSALWQDPDRRMRLDVDANSQTGRLWSEAGETFEKLQGTAQYHWLPQSTGEDYAVQERVSAGKTFGNLPFDELWELGLGGDNDLWMRGHIATRDGRKGSAPLGRDYFLSNLEMDKNIYRWQMIRLIASPFVDTGTIRDDVAGLGSHKWLTDVGASLKMKAFGFGVALSYGKDLRSGNNAIYFTMLR